MFLFVGRLVQYIYTFMRVMMGLNLIKFDYHNPVHSFLGFAMGHKIEGKMC